MVLFKRKPVQYLQEGQIDKNAEVWYIYQTGEIFDRYEEYIARMDFYKQRRFICQISGHSGLTFFEALKSELAGAREIEESFPEALKGPVLRRIQFQTVSRIDTLVDMVYEEFRHDYYPGEPVTIQLISQGKTTGIVREKTQFGSKTLADGTLTPPSTRYFVSLDGRPDAEAMVDDAHIHRDRKHFTKSILRSFIKKTVIREAWNGAPWLVKHDYAAQYHIDTRIPPHLRYDTKLLERKHLQAQKKALQPNDVNGANGSFQGGPARLPELKPAPKSGKGKQQNQQLPHFPHGPKGARAILSGPEPGIFHAPTSGNPFQHPLSYRHQAHSPQAIAVPEPPPPPPPPKYPIEDLQLELRDGVVRPPLGFLCKDPPTTSDTIANGSSDVTDKVLMKSVGPLLETWDTLNVYCEIFKLDSFTFDDFVEAMYAASGDLPVQLFDEVHCAVLKILVSSEADGGKVNVQLPELEEDEEDEEDEDEEDEDKTPTPEPEDKPPARATRSSLAKLEAERLAAEAMAAERENAEAEIKHLAEDLLSDYDWIEHLRQRDFKDGGWQRIMVGLLHQLSKNERHQQSCEDLLAQLVPRDVEPTQETVQQHYASLDVEHRVQALQIICMLTMETKAVRAYMEDCSEQMTMYRKDKIDWQRQRKLALEELRALNDQRKILLPDNMPPSPPLEASKAEDDAKMADPDESPAELEEENPDSDEDAHSRRSIRRANDRAAERQRKRKEELERKEKAELAAKMPKQSKQFIKVLKDIQKKEDFIKKCEDEIAVIDNDLREADCPRTRVLGKDRFWNRYYWFERNGMPYGGLPDSSTSAANYANGCIWVQGPDELEREGYIDLIPEYQNEYKSKFNMTVPERKKLEEGSTSVYNARQWGYYSEPEQVDDLIRWLDPRGFNELKLRKEILGFKEKIVKNMENRKEYLRPAEEKEEKKDDAKRTSMRKRNQQTPEPRNYRCLAWENSMALDELGHLHSEPPPPPRARKQTNKKREAVDPTPAPPPAAKSRRR